MIKSLLNFGFRMFGRRYDYDTSYMSHVADTSISAGLRLSLFPLVSQFRGPKTAQNVWAGALLGSTLEGDCGPCAQLVTDMAVDAHVPADQLAQCIKGKAESAGDVGLGFRFAQAAISGDPELETFRQEIERRFGAAAVTAASFAAANGRMYPVLKRGLGFEQSCRSLSVRNELVKVRRSR